MFWVPQVYIGLNQHTALFWVPQVYIGLIQCTAIFWRFFFIFKLKASLQQISILFFGQKYLKSQYPTNPVETCTQHANLFHMFETRIIQSIQENFTLHHGLWLALNIRSPRRYAMMGRVPVDYCLYVQHRRLPYYSGNSHTCTVTVLSSCALDGYRSS